jgi:hypothetical protein
VIRFGGPGLLAKEGAAKGGRLLDEPGGCGIGRDAGDC